MKRLIFLSVLILSLASCKMTFLAEPFYIPGVDTPLKAWKWVAENIEYKSDLEVHGVQEYWQDASDTYTRRTGDCEDYCILLAALLEGMGQEARLIGVKVEDGRGHMLIESDVLNKAMFSGAQRFLYFVPKNDYKIVFNKDFRNIKSPNDIAFY